MILAMIANDNILLFGRYFPNIFLDFRRLHAKNDFYFWVATADAVLARVQFSSAFSA